MSKLHWRYKNTTLFFSSILIAFFLSKNDAFHTTVVGLSSLGFVGPFLAGMLFVSTFTVALGTVMLLFLAEQLSPLEIGFVAALGSTLTDFFVFRFVKDDVLEEIIPMYEGLGGSHLTRLFHTKYFSWMLPVIGALIIASPLPDEIGVTLLGITKMKTHEFLMLSFLLNAAGIFLFLSAMGLIIR